MMNKGDVVVADDDDKLRTSASQNHVTTTLCTEEFFLSADMCEVGQFMYCTDGQRNTYRWCQLSFSSQPNLYTAEQGLWTLSKTYTIILWLEKNI